VVTLLRFHRSSLMGMLQNTGMSRPYVAVHTLSPALNAVFRRLRDRHGRRTCWSLRGAKDTVCRCINVWRDTEGLGAANIG